MAMNFRDLLVRRTSPGTTEPPDRPRVLVIAPTPFFADRGCHVRIYEEAQVLQDLGYEVEIYTYPIGRDLPGIPTRRTIPVPWYRKLGPGPSYHKLYLDVLLLLTCARSIFTRRPVLIHGHLHEGALLAAVLGKCFGIPCVADLQGSLTRELSDYDFAGNQSLIYRALRTVEGWIDRSAGHIVASSRTMRDDLIERFDVQEDQVTVVEDGVGKGFFEDPGLPHRELYGISTTDRVVVFLGVLTELQGIEILMQAIPTVLSKHVDVTFLVIGYPDEDVFASRAEREGFGDDVIFTGKMDYLAISQTLSMCDLAISPKLSETEGNGKLFNYMAAGLPTLVFDNPVNRDILGDCGIYVESRTADAFASKILETLDGGEATETLGEKARERARRTCSWASNAPILQRVYEKLLR
jgi:glycosyltransferase involved in cell wall biosynthesis